MGNISTAVEKATEPQAPATVAQAIHANRAGFEAALPRHVTVDRFMRIALTALRTVPKLAECTERSVVAGLMQAAQLGLEISDVRGQAYLIPRWNKSVGANEATFQLGYRGMIDLAARAGITVDVDTIYDNDTYTFERGTDAHLRHIPTFEEPGKPVAYYAVAHFPDNRRPQFLIRSKPQIEDHRKKFSPAGTRKTPWDDHFDAMARKTVVRMLLDKLPTSAELREAVVVDAVNEAVDAGQATYTPLYVPAEAVERDDVDPTSGELLPPADDSTEPDPAA